MILEPECFRTELLQPESTTIAELSIDAHRWLSSGLAHDDARVAA